MGSGFVSRSLLVYVLLVVQCAYGCTARELTKGRRNPLNKGVYDLQQARDDHLQIYAKQEASSDHNVLHEMHIDNGYHQKTLKKHVDGHPSSHTDHIDPALNIFFAINDLYLGKKMPIYFAVKDPSTSPHLLPREEVDSIPFSSSQLPYLLEFFSFSEGSPQAKAMEDTLGQCEFESMKGETKFCATSFESLLDSTRGILGLDAHLKVLTTTILSSKPTTLLQNYTILEVPKEILAPKMLACHTMPYPYAVFYCHFQESDKKLFKVSLGGENGDRVEGPAICHMDTSQWDPDHVAFRVLRTQPGSSPVCHFFPPDNLVWVSSITISNLVM